ncbi:MAG: Ig-like domain-containing protein, partial [Anaerolineae bacterium]|nr:Ig-like domain-containing protein [Anaerolineae bacterium]
VRNRGKQAASGEVGVFWDRSRIGWPCKVGAPNVGVIPFENLLPGEVRIVALSWVPQEPGRHGLHTVIDATGDPADRSAPCSPHRPRWDNNVSWRNVVVHLRSPQGAWSQSAIEERVVLANVYAWPIEMDLLVERMTFPTTGTLTIRLGEELFDRWQSHEGHWAEGVVVVTPTQEILVTGAVSATVGTIPMRSGEEVTLTLTIDAPEQGAFEMALQERVDGLVVGGVGYQWIIADPVPPQIAAHLPARSAGDVPLDAPIVITFTEQIAPPTFQLALTPHLDDWDLSWNEAGTVATVTHTAFAPATEYLVTIAACDTSANPMETPYSWSFTTQEGGIVYLPLVLRRH